MSARPDEIPSFRSLFQAHVRAEELARDFMRRSAAARRAGNEAEADAAEELAERWIVRALLLEEEVRALL